MNEKLQQYVVTFTAPEIEPCTKEHMKMLLSNAANWPVIESIEIKDV